MGETYGANGVSTAYAKLFVAAPDLVAALEYIVSWDPDRGKWNPETARDLARAAIAKARS